MKTTEISLCLALLILTAFSCSFNDDSDETIIDYPNFNFVTVWKENEVKFGSDSTETIPDEIELQFFFDDSIIPKTGEYRYVDSNYLVQIDTVGYFIQNDSLFYFISKKDSLASESLNQFKDVSGQAKVVRYEINDSILSIRDTLANPTIEIKYEMERN